MDSVRTILDGADGNRTCLRQGRNVGENGFATSGGRIGAWVVLLWYPFTSPSDFEPDIEGLNYFTDTLMFGSVFLIASCAYDPPRKPRVS